MTQLGKALPITAAVLLTVACGARPGDSGTPATNASPAATAATTTTTTAATTTAKATTTATAVALTVPDVSGMNHQDAQDAMQAAGLYNLREVDSSGRHRLMILDRDWCQTGQDPKPGAKADAGTVVTLYADKC
ncbi:PASTA domain-containing protein [Amycolatopsis rhabdoformis]|uniref:PASTA domain-containing protein n=1 Tax=Amycolatopsis rhabdoformis TaxID=1448059 RepID=A0ABZ1IEQ4_9PSEU|nr:PASTA domain-containing protein [Amycolatopsis rhabdoformis]WSE31930.1 PASTA domain-containing protein [Amycolatopsis rhabdoformis]